MILAKNGEKSWNSIEFLYNNFSIIHLTKIVDQRRLYRRL